MIELEAKCLKAGDEITLNDGESWQTIQDIEQAKCNDGEYIYIYHNTNGERKWLWDGEMVVTR